MPRSQQLPPIVMGVNPLGEPNARLAAAVSHAGGLGVLELGDGGRCCREALELSIRWVPRGFGVRVDEGCRLRPAELPTPEQGGPHTIVLAARAPWSAADLAGSPERTVLAEVTGIEEARAAVRAGADGLILRGSECGGPVGELSAFILLQQAVADPAVDVPVWLCGAMGPHTAAAAVIGGAAGVVLDIQLALLAEAELPAPVAAALRTTDGSETVVVGGHRILHRRPGAGAQQGDRAVPVGQDAFLAGHFERRYGTAGTAVRAVREAVHRAVADRAGGVGEAGDVLRAGSPMAQALGTRLPIAQGPMTRVSDQARFAAVVAEEGGLPFIALALAGPDRVRDVLERTRSTVGDRSWGVGVLGFAPEKVRAAQLEVVRQLRPSHAIIAGGRPSQAAVLEAEGIRTFLHVPSPGLLGQFLRAGARRFVFEGAECGGHVGPRNSFALWEAQLAVLEDFLDEKGSPAGSNTAAKAAEKTVAKAADDLDPRTVEVFFAGGVHDERSAAMVAALAAPLTARGVRIGVLMGTAYLFTEEAVGCGAIQPLFQRRVVAAEATTLLQTSPGHATRCVPSPFADSFRARKDELRRRGVPEREAWQELERLNVGRLRIAGKGVKRIGDELVAVDEQRQLAEGLFMAGQVAVLRSATTTIAALHRAAGPGAAEYYARRAGRIRTTLRLPDPPPEGGISGSDLGDGRSDTFEPAIERASEPAPEPLDIAVVGMACMFPGAPDLPTFWANVISGADAVTEVPAHRWDPAVYYGDGPQGDTSVAKSASRWGGFLPEIPFDALAYGIPPTALASIEPVQLLALEAARRALTDAGYATRAFPRARTCVVFGAEAGSDTSNATTLRTVLPSYFGRLPRDLDEQLPALTEDSFLGMLANVISGRIANRLDLGGANYTVDAACASSLAAVDAACKELAAGTADMALCGGADLHNGINDYLLFSSVHALSGTGRCRPFDAGADGIALGEGVACLVLKRRADAERDGDRIYAVIDGVGSASDGRSLGLSAPRPEGQRAAIERALCNARVSPARVGLVEAHGTGTVVGDRTELATLSAVFQEGGARRGGCVLGSVKSQIGHTKCAAGLAGLIKTALALHTGVRPPTLHLTKPNPAWDPDHSPFVFHDRALPWATPPGQRLAGVSAFGFGGTNFHVVLRGYGEGYVGERGGAVAAAPPRQGLSAWPAELFIFRGADRQAVRPAAEALLELVTAGERHGRPWRLRDLALTAARRAEAGPGPVRVAFVADCLDALPGLLTAVRDGADAPGLRWADHTTDGPDNGLAKVAFLFPGQGSQRPGMLAELLTAFPGTQRYLQYVEDIGRTGGADGIADALYPPAAFDAGTREAQRSRIDDTRIAQPALGVVSLAAYDVLTSVGVRPDAAAGHSYGELVALCAAGALDPRDLIELSVARAEAMLEAVGDGADPGTMAAVTAGADTVSRALREAGLAGRVVVANHNAPDQTVISGPTDAVRQAVEYLAAAGHTARPLPVACAFHSPLLAGAGERFARALADRTVRAPEFPVWANVTAAPYPTDPGEVRGCLVDQIGSPVRFAEQIEALYRAGVRTFVEAGAGRVLIGLVGRILGDRPHVAVACEPRADAGAWLPGFLDTLARLAVAGVPVAPERLFLGRDAVPADLDAIPRRPGWTVDGQLVRTAAGELLPGALQPARRIKETTVPPSPQPPNDSGRDALVSEFLRSSREMVAAQRDVLLTYLGAAAAGPAPSDASGATSGAAVVPAAVPVISGEAVSPVSPVSPVPAVPAMPGAPALAAATGSAEPGPAEARLVNGRPMDGRPGERGTGQPGTAALTEESLQKVVRSVISERTGYPVDMIEPDLDLEADLSVDSIKRTEMVGELGRRLSGRGLDVRSLPDAEVEELTRARTVTAITSWLAARVASGATAPERLEDRAPGNSSAPGHGSAHGYVGGRWYDGASHPDGAPASKGHDGALTSAVGAPERYVLRPVTLPDAAPEGAQACEAGALSGLRFMVLGDGTPVAQAVVARLADCGAEAVLLAGDCLLDEGSGRVDGVVHLGSLSASGPVLPGVFPVFQSAFARGPRRLVCARAVGDEHGAGLRGFFRAAAREYPDTLVRLVEFDPARPASELAGALVGELMAPDPTPVVIRTADGRRQGVEPIEARLGPLATAGAGPAGDGAAAGAALGLGPESVVVLTGGARGITARCAVAFAAASRCRIELLGRTPLPKAPERADTAGAADPTALRAALAGRGGLAPAQIERTATRILAQRQVAATLAELRAVGGGEIGYHSVDLRDAEAVWQAVKDIHARHGRIDGVVHAAGVIEDRLLAEKDADSFARVYGTKVGGARNLLGSLGALPQPPRFTVLFGSIAGVLGNRGQCDYAAANDALATLGRRWAEESGSRTLTVHWGPWAPAPGSGTGMVTPELGREYARRGISLIDPEKGALALLRELAWGEEGVDEVLHTAPGW